MQYKKVLLKLSGESLTKKGQAPIDYQLVSYFAQEIKSIYDLGVEIGIVIGGGNIYRGRESSTSKYDRVQGDYMGMIATVINAMSIKEALQNTSLEALVMSPLPINKVVKDLNLQDAVEALSQKKIVIFAGGLGEPYFTTDSAAAIRAVQIEADVLLKGTRVDGVYDDDPEKNVHAVMFEEISFDAVMEKRIKVMDATAFASCRENNLPIIVFNMNQKGNLLKILKGEKVGSLIS